MKGTELLSREEWEHLVQVLEKAIAKLTRACEKAIRIVILLRVSVMRHKMLMRRQPTRMGMLLVKPLMMPSRHTTEHLYKSRQPKIDSHA